MQKVRLDFPFRNQDMIKEITFCVIVFFDRKRQKKVYGIHLTDLRSLNRNI